MKKIDEIFIENEDEQVIIIFDDDTEMIVEIEDIYDVLQPTIEEDSYSQGSFFIESDSSNGKERELDYFEFLNSIEESDVKQYYNVKYGT